MFFLRVWKPFDMDRTLEVPQKWCVTFAIWKTHGKISLNIIFNHLFKFKTFCSWKKCNDLWFTVCSFAWKREVSLKKHPTWAFEKISGEARSLMYWADRLCPHFKGTMVCHALLEPFLAQKLKKRHCHCAAYRSWDQPRPLTVLRHPHIRFTVHVHWY